MSGSRNLSTSRLLNLSGRYPVISAPFTKLHAKLFERTDGRFMNKWLQGAPVMVIETIGRKSGEVRKAPILYMPDGENFVVVAANGGNHRTPAWWLNLDATGEGYVIARGQRHKVTRRVAHGDERSELWDRFAEVYDGINDYETFTDRELPVVVLERITN